MEAVLDSARWVGIGKNYVNTHYQDSIEKERMEWMRKINYVFTFTYDGKKHIFQRRIWQYGSELLEPRE